MFAQWDAIRAQINAACCTINVVFTPTHQEHKAYNIYELLNVCVCERALYNKLVFSTLDGCVLCNICGLILRACAFPATVRYIYTEQVDAACAARCVHLSAIAHMCWWQRVCVRACCFSELQKHIYNQPNISDMRSEVRGSVYMYEMMRLSCTGRHVVTKCARGGYV